MDNRIEPRNIYDATAPCRYRLYSLQLNGARQRRGEKTPLTRDALERVGAARVKAYAGAGNQILDRVRDENFARGRQGSNSGGRMNCYPTDVLADHLAFSRVKPSSKLDADRANRVDDASRTANAARRSVERGENAVTRCAHLDATELLKLAPYPCVEIFKKIAPALVAKRRSPLGRADDVDEQDRRKDAIQRRFVAHPSQKLFDFIDNGVGICAPGQMVAT